MATIHFMDSTKTQRLANPNWRPSAVTARAMVGAFGALTGTETGSVVRSRPAKTTRSMATTTQLPTIGRAGTRERVLASDACFGGSETR